MPGPYPREFRGDVAAAARANLERAEAGDRVDVIMGPAAASARALIDEGVESFDLVFIDADKPSDPISLAAAPELTGPGAAIAIDNVVRDGAVADENSDDPRVQGVRAVVDAIALQPERDATALQTVGETGWDGPTLARRREEAEADADADRRPVAGPRSI